MLHHPKNIGSQDNLDKHIHPEKMFQEHTIDIHLGLILFLVDKRNIPKLQLETMH